MLRCQLRTPEYGIGITIGQNSQHGGWFQFAGQEASFITGMNPVNEFFIPLGTSIKVVTKRPVYKDKNHITVGVKETETEPLQQQGKDVLRPDALKALG